MTLDALTDFCVMDLTAGCALPQILNNSEIHRIITQVCLPWFWENYQFAVIKSYYYVPESTLRTDEFARFKYITLPDEIQNIVWLYQMNKRHLFELGIAGAANLNSGVAIQANQQYASSALSSIGELGVYKTIIDGFADQLNQLSKNTLKFDFNFGAHKLNILTYQHGDLMLETYARIDDESIYEMEKFRRYALAQCKMQLGRLLTRFDFNLPGDIKINGAAILTEGTTEVEAVKNEIKGQSQTGFFFMVS